MRLSLKYPAFGLAVFIVLLAGVLAFSQTRPFKNWLRDRIVQAGGAFLNGRLQIGRLDGNLFSHLEILDLLVASHSDTVLYLPKLSVELKPKRLLRKEILIEKILLDSLYLALRELPDSTWNLSKLVVYEPSEEPLGWLVTLADLHLHEALITVSPLDTAAMLPRRIENINANLAMSYSDSLLDARVQGFRFHTREPNFDLQELSLRSRVRNNEIELRDFILRTGKNRIAGRGDFNTADSAGSTAQLNIAALDFSEFQLVVPELRIHGRPEINLTGDFQKDSLGVALTITEEQQQILLDAAYLTTGSTPRYRLAGSVKNFNLGHWLNDPAFSTLLNGNFQLHGRGASPEQAAVQARAVFRNGMIMQRALDSLSLQVEYANSRALGTLRVNGEFGETALEANLFDLEGAQEFAVTGAARHLNAATLALNDSLPTDLNFAFKARGRGLNVDAMRAQVELEVERSQLLELPLDTLFTRVQIDGRQYLIDTLHARSPVAQLSLAGVVDLNAASDLRFSGRLDDLTLLKPLLAADTLHASGFFQGRVQGKMDSLAAAARFTFEELAFNQVLVDSLSGNLAATRTPDDLFGNFIVQLKKVRASALLVDSINLRGDLASEQQHFFLDLAAPDSVSSALEMKFFPDSLQPKIAVPSFVFQYKNQIWRGGSDSTQVVINGENYEIQNVRLTSGGQMITAHGALSTAGAENFRVHADSLQLDKLAELAGLTMPVSGKLSFDIDLQGEASAPRLEGDFVIANGLVNELAFARLLGNLDYADRRLNWVLEFNRTPDRRVTGSGFLPMNLAFDNEGEMMYDDRPLRAEIKTEGVPLDVLLAAQFGLENVQGKIVYALKVENTLKDPHVSGFVNLEDAAFDFAKYGMNYRDVQLQLVLEKARLALQKLQARHGQGVLTASGEVDFENSLASGKITAARFELSANDFLVASNKDLEIVIKGGASLSGGLTSPRYGGELTILRSRFFLPAFMEEQAVAAESREALPLLVAATTKPDCTLAQVVARTPQVQKEATTSFPDYVKNMRGSLKLTIPRNTWITGPEMKIELDGELEIAKSGPDFEIFGTINTLRGTYAILYKYFNIISGTITFQGGKEYNPEVAIEAEHEFRDAAQQKKSLKLKISDKALSPKFDFTLDDEKIEMGDAVAYVMFGRSLDELTHGEKSAAGEGSLAVSMISSQISRAVGNNLGLDVFEIRGQSLEQASFAIGKYVTNDIFVSYEKQFNSSDNDAAASQLITLEYELAKFLSMQLIQGDDKKSGFDVFLKFEK